MGPSKNNQLISLNESDLDKPLEEYFKVAEQFHEPQQKLTRKERRAFQRKLKKPKFQKIGKIIIQSKSK